MAKDDNIDLESSSEDDIEDDESTSQHLTRKQLKEYNFRLSLAQQSICYRKLMTCQTDEEFHKSLDTLPSKSLKIMLGAILNVFRGRNLKTMSNREFEKFKRHKSHLIENLGHIQLSRLSKDTIKNTLKNLTLPIFKKVLKLHKRIEISGLES